MAGGGKVGRHWSLRRSTHSGAYRHSTLWRSTVEEVRCSRLAALLDGVADRLDHIQVDVVRIRLPWS
jgi:hypothetical protein